MSNEDAERSAPRSDPAGDSSASDASESGGGAADETEADATEADAAEAAAIAADAPDEDTPSATDSASKSPDHTDDDSPGDDSSDDDGPDDGASEPPESDEGTGSNDGPPVVTGRYSWRSLLTERGHEGAAKRVYGDVPDAPAVPADAVALHLPDGVDEVIRAAGVDEPFETDGETAVPGHGTPERGTLVIGLDAVLLSGSAVVPTGERRATPPTSLTAETDESGGETADDAEGSADADPETDPDEVAEPEPAETTDAADVDPDAGPDPDAGLDLDAGSDTVFAGPVGRGRRPRNRRRAR